MFALMQLFVALVSNRFKSPRRLEIENLYLRHQLNIALRQTRHRFRLKGADRALLVWMTWLWPSMLSLSRVVQPDRSCAGIGRAFEPTGAGNTGGDRVGPGLPVSCARSFGR